MNIDLILIMPDEPTLSFLHVKYALLPARKFYMELLLENLFE